MMGRHKDKSFNCGDGSNVDSVDHAQLAVLMDIRDELKVQNAELKTLNRLLHCRNFTGMPKDLRQINKRLAQDIKIRPGRSRRST